MKFISEKASLLSRLIRHRRAVYPIQYFNREISKDHIDLILENANWAPTHKRTEPWRYKVLQGQRLLKFGEFLANKYQEITPADQFRDTKSRKIMRKCQQSAMVILICMQRSEKSGIPEWEEIASTAMSVQNMWLTCHSLGIGAYWSSPPMISHMSEFVSLGEGERCLGMFYMGYCDTSTLQGQRSPISEKVQWFE